MPPVTDTLQAAAAGDQRAWDELVARFNRLVWSVARGNGLGREDAAEVVQSTWLHLVEHLDRIEDPERLAGWLVTTARRESYRVLRLSSRTSPTEEEVLEQLPSPAPDVGTALLTAERDRALWAALGRLGARCQELLRLLVSDPPMPYEAISAALGMPIGSIGPTRARCLDRLRKEAAAGGITDGAGGLL